jgi:hypothetical protein
MRGATQLGEPFLPVPFGIAGALGRGAVRVAGGTTHALGIQRRRAILSADRPSATMAKRVGTGGKAMPDRDALVEHEALPFPEALLGGDSLKIF